MQIAFKNNFAKIIAIIYFFMLLWWFAINIQSQQDTLSNFLFGAFQGVLPIVGSIFGFFNARKWGWVKSTTGKSLILLSAGLFTWGFGTLIFAYYNIILQVAVPYPSLADAFYIVSWPLWMFSMVYLSRATGAQYQLKNNIGRLTLLIIPLLTALLSYYLLIVVAREGVIGTFDNPLKTFFDLAYPIGDLVILTLAVLIYGLSFKYLGGIFKWPIIFILLGFIANYFGDFSFVYSTTKETYFVANWIDLIYTTAFFFLSVGVCLIRPSFLVGNTDLQHHDHV